MASKNVENKVIDVLVLFQPSGEIYVNFATLIDCLVLYLDDVFLLDKEVCHEESLGIFTVVLSL